MIKEASHTEYKKTSSPLTLRLILGDQLSHDISSLNNCNKSKDIILMCEVWNEATYVKHHIKKIAFIFSAMRHFANELKSKDYKIKYYKLTIEDTTSSFTSVVEQYIKKYNINKLVITEPGEYRVLKEIKGWKNKFNIDLEILPDDRFLCGIDEFKEWLNNYKQPRMEFFYRYMRAKHNILFHNNRPIGGKWNFDQNNRKLPPKNLKTNKRYSSKTDDITKEIISLVSKKFNSHFGELEPFYFAVTRQNARKALADFIDNNLSKFGDYQDAMLEGEPWMFHSLISQYINIGLLNPRECIQAAEQAHHNKVAPLNAVEGFIRQILGWREYVRGIYWAYIPQYAEYNFLDAKRKLPEFFWSSETDMNCLKQCIQDTQNNAYAHHIQRLMVLGNFLLLIGVHPQYVNEWYLIVYADAFEWVEMPNVTGMILYADGGILASKPYAASGAYINKMSNYCQNCKYKVKEKNGPDACPFNYLYWNFLITNQKVLSKNQRMGMIYNTLNKMSAEKINMIKQDSEKFLDDL